MKKEFILRKLTKRVDEICSDDEGAEKPYSEHCKKWAKILYEDFKSLTTK